MRLPVLDRTRSGWHLAVGVAPIGNSTPLRTRIGLLCTIPLAFASGLNASCRDQPLLVIKATLEDTRPYGAEEREAFFAQYRRYSEYNSASVDLESYFEDLVDDHPGFFATARIIFVRRVVAKSRSSGPGGLLLGSWKKGKETVKVFVPQSVATPELGSEPQTYWLAEACCDTDPPGHPACLMRTRLLLGIADLERNGYAGADADSPP